MKRSLYAFLSNQKQDIFPKDASLESQMIQARITHILKEQENALRFQTKAKEQQITFMNLWTHQMKTPISVLELMAQDNQLDPVAVLKETQRLKNGLNLALNEARLVDGIGNDFQLKQLSLTEIVMTTINVQKNYFIHHQVYPKVTMKEDICVISDEKWLMFVIEQLVINSVKYSTPQGTVLIEGESKNGIPTLTITDFGIGIPSEDLPRIKQAFFTGENGRSFGEATGMGLYLVEQVVQSLAITIDIHSERSKGTTVILSFPAN
ncbi:ATP-binding protein [Enterococcus sp. LJL99]